MLFGAILIVFIFGDTGTVLGSGLADICISGGMSFKCCRVKLIMVEFGFWTGMAWFEVRVVLFSIGIVVTGVGEIISLKDVIGKEGKLILVSSDDVIGIIFGKKSGKIF